MTAYDKHYILKMLRQATDFAEIEHDFAPLRKWLNELEIAINSRQYDSNTRSGVYEMVQSLHAQNVANMSMEEKAMLEQDRRDEADYVRGAGRPA